MTDQTKKWSTAIAALLACALTPRLFAAPTDDPRVRFMTEITHESGADVRSYMKETGLTPRELVRRRLPTPAQVAQYQGAPQDPNSAPSLTGGDLSAREAIMHAAELTFQADKTAKDAPRKYVAETGKEVVAMMAKLYNSTFLDVNHKVNDIQQKMDTVVAIAVVLNSGNGGNGEASTQPGKQAQQVQQIRQGNGYIDQSEVSLGEGLKQLTGREIPMAKYAKSLRGDAEGEARAIPQELMSAANVLDEAKKKTADLARKEQEYRHGMKGHQEDSTAQLLNAAIDKLGNQMVNLKMASEQYMAFLNGPGKATDKVLDCSEATYDFGVILTRDASLQAKLSAGDRAIEANLAATKAATYAAQEKFAVAWLKSQVMPTSEVTPPGYQAMSAPKAGMSQSGETEKARKRARENAESLTQ